MARARQAVAKKSPASEGRGPGARSAPGRSPHLSQAATDLAQLLRARAFCLSGEGPLIARVASNLETFGGQIDEDAAAWIGIGTPQEGRVALSLGESAGALGPHSFGFLNNIDGIAPLAAPFSQQDRPRRGHLAWVVPRRDALPEVAPLLSARGLGVSWLISVGDGDPAEVLRFLALDPATSAILLSLGRGARAQTLYEALGDKPIALLEPSSLPVRDSCLIRAVARRAGAVVTSQLEEWLAHAALLDAAAAPGAFVVEPKARLKTGSSPARRLRAAVVVAGAGADFVSSEVHKVRTDRRAQLVVRAVDMDSAEGDERARLESVLRQAALDAQVVVLCGAGEAIADVTAPGPLLRVDPGQPERLRAVLGALASPPLVAVPGRDDKTLESAVARERVEAVLADLPPPLYVGGAVVCDEVLGDHDCKRLLHAYGVRVSRQAPANTTTAALRILGKLNLPVELLPALSPQADVERVVAEEAQSRILCGTQAEVKRQATLLLSRSPYVLLRESLPKSAMLRVQASKERGLGMLLRLIRVDAAGGRAVALAGQNASWEAALLPLRLGEARQLCEGLVSSIAAEHSTSLDPICDAKELCELLAGLSVCLTEHALTLDLLLRLGPEPAVTHAAGVLERKAVPR